MPLDWLDVSELSFNSLLLLERVQISWFPGWVREDTLALALGANPAVEWFLRHKCPEVQGWLDGVMARRRPADPREVHEAERAIMRTINDLLVYVVDPAIYDAQPFLGWDSQELTSLVDFAGKTVVDVGAGTGRLAFVAAESGAAAVFAVEPIGNLRAYIRDKAAKRGLTNIYTVDGIITRIPFPDAFADVVMGGHVFGDDPEREYHEMARVTKRGGMVILCPGNNDKDEGWHDYLVGQRFEWSRFEEPGDGAKRKYWKPMP